MMRLDVRLPDGREIQTGYDTLWPCQRLNAVDLLRLAAAAGFEMAACAEDGLAFALELRKPIPQEPAQP